MATSVPAKKFAPKSRLGERIREGRKSHPIKPRPLLKPDQMPLISRHSRKS